MIEISNILIESIVLFSFPETIQSYMKNFIDNNSNIKWDDNIW